MIKNISFGNILHSGRIAVIFIYPIDSGVDGACEGEISLATFIQEMRSKNIPMVSCLPNPKGSQLGVFGENGVKLPSLKNFEILNANPCLDSIFTEIISGFDRSTLLLISTTIEGHLAMIALSFLELGYDVCVLADIAESPLRALDRFAFDRLMQAGVVLLTMKQVLLELQSH